VVKNGIIVTLITTWTAINVTKELSAFSFRAEVQPLRTQWFYMYHILQDIKPLYSVHRVYLCVPYGSHNKQRLFPPGNSRQIPI
jgi:hypothetical protein